MGRPRRRTDALTPPRSTRLGTAGLPGEARIGGSEERASLRSGREAGSWDEQYRNGRYRSEPPVAFVEDILEAARSHDAMGGPGLYVGCGNGRNYLPLVAGGLDLFGLDISRVAIEQLAARAPARRSRLIVGDISALPRDARFAMVVGIQVFQHGRRAETHRHIQAAQDHVAGAGLFALRVNAVGTDTEHDHSETEHGSDGGLTISYLAGPKAGLDVHFFSELELDRLFEGWEPAMALRSQVTWRSPPARGQWTQWEGIWKRPG